MCPECEDSKLYTCENCRWRGTNTITNYMNETNTYRWCHKFDQELSKLQVDVFKDIQCPIWELPKNVNYCKTCGRYLRG